eukprot:CAMPEP_0172783362 /NCGR_PEP_ID=MMETSP1074-20121228/204396_1 /TAXON_ID=2916 /ORGANISM="Ceratium fusus, Strain PA161109" /LENGTH=140 /DNA_ID=CAMNT_0013620351 /DNA_START=895 /DNA_END=1318 /DNA_ORIENTATION=-
MTAGWANSGIGAAHLPWGNGATLSRSESASSAVCCDRSLKNVGGALEEFANFGQVGLTGVVLSCSQSSSAAVWCDISLKNCGTEVVSIVEALSSTLSRVASGAEKENVASGAASGAAAAKLLTIVICGCLVRHLTEELWH